MADYDSSIIKPVEGLQNITGLAPARRREQRRHRQQLHEENKEKDESAEAGSDESLDESAKGQDNLLQEPTESDPNPDDIGIDYCA